MSGALSQIILEPGPIAGRKIGVFADAAADLSGIGKLRSAIEKGGAKLHVIAPTGGVLSDGTDQEIVERTLLTVRSIELDAVVVADGVEAGADIKLVLLLQEAYRHCKAVGAWGSGTAILQASSIDLDSPGVVTGRSAGKSLSDALIAAVGLHRAWERAPMVMASQVPPAT